MKKFSKVPKIAILGLIWLIIFTKWSTMGTFDTPEPTKTYTWGHLPWQVLSWGYMGNYKGFNCSKFVNLAPKKRVLSSSGGLAPVFYQIWPHRPPKNYCPNQGAQLIPFGVIWGVKHTHSGTFSEYNLLK